MKKIVSISLVVVLISTLFVSCYNYNDINKITFVTSVIFDENDLGDIDIYVDCVKAYRSANESSEKGKRLIFKGHGRSVLEAIRSINVSTSTKINFTQCKAYIFTEKAAVNGIGKYIDILNKDQELLIRPYMFILNASPEDIFLNVESDEEYIGMFINELVSKNAKNPNIVAMNINEYLNKRLNLGSINLIGIINVSPDVKSSKIEIKRAAIIKDDIMIGKLNVGECMAYNFLTNDLSLGDLEITNPENPDSFITLELLKSNVKTNIKYENEKIILVKKIKIKCSVDDIQKRIMLNETAINNIQNIANDTLVQYLNILFEGYKKKGIDILNVKELVERKYHNLNIKKDILSITDLKADVKVEITGGSIGNSRY